MGEFDLIRRFFQRPVRRAALGVGDDCALLAPAPGMQLAVSSDMLVEGRHFFADVDPRLLGHKCLAVNLSDLAACGARPLAFTLALSLPRADAAWTEAFAGGLLALADAHGCELVGGDTTQGPLNICITVFGEVPPGQALLRSGARAGDDIWVSGSLGDARLALEALLGHTTLPPGTLAAARQRLEAPTPRVALGQALRGIASSALDVSDGLLGDLGHILAQSRVGASLDTRLITPLLDAGRHTPLAIDLLHQCTLSGGDDYELCFTAPADRRDAVQAAGRDSATRVTRIGCIEEQPGLRLIGPDGAAMAPRWTSFDHFAAA
ncbi:thiamine-monophosphate kinase [Delftia acidovorans SPH-1]|uniref:Thiamine-monophosphate kinase n=1 Tax=Delftia acidovorans (strain DSM 14801 / SPH-1) TaxID=398578 RepID=A9BRJ6_DELAS|nr:MULTISPECIES: thiamine-phosphate kinase [Delftia]MBA4003088.1 thiamine-phosphate kinase [Delftia sp.]ABX33357.1 thiamine-monophosphate kinase [Delftia acidovorans SPH-1]MCP4016103.1 thiamine-phosphate kinase [Delftia sp.]MCP4531120.1 thiamine-phosphate kinase [Delftia sp.]OLE03613.1 MAG: thiamine-phosphate kinase [Delftia sp. 13_1_20CM_4_67_18]